MIFGYVVTYDAAWRLDAGTESGSLDEVLSGEARFFDHFHPDDLPSVEVLVTSALLTAGTSEDAFIEAYRRPVVQAYGERCSPPRDQWAPLTISSVAGGVYAGCNYVEAMFFAERRAYIVTWALPFGTEPGEHDRQSLLAFLDGFTFEPRLAPVATTTFVSSHYGYEVIVRATEAVTAGHVQATLEDVQTRRVDALDRFYPFGTMEQVLLATSVPIRDGMSNAAWISRYLDGGGTAASDRCIPPQTEWNVVTADGRPGWQYTGCDFVEALFFVGGRAYVFAFAKPGQAIGKYEWMVLAGFLRGVTFRPDRAAPA